jgi:hypothetical protein
MVACRAAPAAVADFLTHLHQKRKSSFRLVLVVVGLAVIWASLHFSVWSLRQRSVVTTEDLSGNLQSLEQACRQSARPGHLGDDYHSGVAE